MIVRCAGKIRPLPDFFIVGAMRCGTTSLFKYLQRDPAIFMPAMKEPHFFSYFGKDDSSAPEKATKDPWDLEAYCTLFHGAVSGQTVGEASTSYLYRFPETIENMRAIYGEKAKTIKILGILRNPVERAWSIYSLRRQGGIWADDFFSIIKEFENNGNRFQYWNFIHSGKYAEQVRAFQGFFPETKFFLFEELKENPEQVVTECLSFLGVSPHSVPSNLGTPYNFSGVPRSGRSDLLYRVLFHRNRVKDSLKPLVPQAVRSALKFHLGRWISTRQEMPEEERAYLRRIFAKDIQALSDLIPDDHRKQIVGKWLEGNA